MWYEIDFEKPVEVSRFSRIKYSETWNRAGKRAHIHKLIIVIKGGVRYRVDEHEYTLTAGDCILIPKDCQYASDIEDMCDFYYINFDAALRGPFDEETGRRLFAAQAQNDAELDADQFVSVCPDYDVWIRDVVHLGKEFESVLSLLSKLDGNRYVRFPANKLVINNRIEDLLLRLSRQAVCDVIPYEDAPPLLSRVVGYIRQNYTQDISTARIAEAFGLSPQYIMRLFRSYMGTTVSKFINDLRLERALILLKVGAMNVNEIASFLGYHSACYFCRVFKAAYQMTPTEFIKGNKNMP